MDKKEILAFISENPIANMATAEGNKPHVRAMETYRADDDGLIFYTGKTKKVGQQLKANPEIEVSYFAKGLQVRVCGRVEAVEDMSFKEEIVEARNFLKPYIEEYGWDNLAVYCLKNGKATTWSMQDMIDPTAFIDL